ncbi:MAG: low molecular weight phosphotyrosine protein phosphatase [Solirubrobacterales bacterium]|nr:low molecular weight phosphotyrosine protein phosphatase [Solirubrobacterales bacterium]
MRILFVCLGNICRSPTAEGVFRQLIEWEGLAGRIEVDSAGTGHRQVGKSPDPRAVDAASRRGIELSGTARQVTYADWEAFDLVVAMDRQNRADLVRLFGSGAKVELLREFSRDDAPDVPDPYLGEGGYDEVLEIIERACGYLLEEVKPAIGS